MKKRQKAKLNKPIIGFAIVILTFMYLFATVAVAQDSTKTAETSIEYQRDYLSWGDIWAFDSNAHNSSNYARNDAYTPDYYSNAKTSNDNTDSTKGKGQFYNYASVKVAANGDTAGSVTMNTHTYAEFNSNVSQGTMEAPVDNRVTIPVMTTSGTGIYSVVPDTPGAYSIYAYSTSGSPTVSYSLLDSPTSANDYTGAPGTALSFSPVTGASNWYVASITVENVRWHAVAVGNEHPLTGSGHSSNTINDSGGQDKSMALTGGSTTYYYNNWSTTNVYYNTVLALKFDSSVKLGPITKTDGTFSITNDDTKGTVIVKDIFGQSVGTSYSGVHIPLFISANALSQEYPFTGVEGGSVEPVADGLYRFDFEGTSNLTAKWDKMVNLPTVTVNGSTVLNAYFSPSGSATFTNGRDTVFTFAADFSGAVAGSTLTYTVVNNGKTTNGSLTAADSTLNVTASFDTVTVEFTAIGDGTRKTMTYTITGNDNGLTKVARIGTTAGTNEYCFLEDALAASNNGTSGNIYIIADCTMYSGENPRAAWKETTTDSYQKGYYVKSGVTLVVPYSTSTTIHTTEPSLAAAATRSCYRKLTVPGNVALTVGGSVSVDSQMDQNNGKTSGPYGMIVMEARSSMTFNNGANLYCWGYINGDGDIIMQSGSTVYEGFQLGNWRGGQATLAMNNNSKKVFPINQYFIQNVEAPMTLYAGAVEKVCNCVNVKYLGNQFSAATFITTGSATDGMFRISSGYITKRYLATTDHLLIEVHGDVTINSMTIKVSSYDLVSGKYVLPITNNLDITVSAGTVTAGQHLGFLAGSVLTIDEGGTFDIPSGVDVFIYDLDEWNSGDFASGTNGTKKLEVSGFSTANGTKTMRTATNIGDTIVDINGTMQVSGGLYTTASGANITSSKGTGSLVFKSPAATTTVTTAQANQSGTSISYVDITCNNAWLHNGDGTYSKTVNTGTSTFKYDKDGEHWYRYLVDFKYKNNTVAKGYYCDADDTVTYDASSMISDTPVATVETGTATVSVDAATKVVSVTAVTENTVVAISGAAYAYKPVFVLNQTQYNAYVSYTGNTLSDTKTINGATYYVVQAATSPIESGTAHAAPTDEAMGITAENLNGIIWNMSGVSATSGDPYLGVVPTGAESGGEVYIYGFYTGYVAYNSFTGEYYTTLAEAMSFVPQSGTTTVTMMANCGTFEEESGTSLFTIYKAANVTLNLNGFTGWGRVDNQGTLTIETNGGTLFYKTGATAAAAAYRGFAAVTNTGTLTIQDSSGSGNGKITTDLLQDNSTVTNYAAVVRNNASGTLKLDGVTLEATQTVNNYFAGVLNLSGGNVTQINDCTISVQSGYGLYNYSGSKIGTIAGSSISSMKSYGLYNYSGSTIDTIAGSSVSSASNYCIFNDGSTISNITSCEMTGLKGIWNRNLRGANTLAAGYNISKYGKIVLIKDTDITVSQYGILNYAVIDEVNGCTITAHPDSAQVDTMGNGLSSALIGDNECRAVFNGNAWWCDTNKWKQVDSGLTRTDEYLEDEAYRPTIKKIVDCTILAENTSAKADHGCALYNEGGIIGEISGTTTIKTYKHPSNASNITSNYAIRNTAGGIIKSIAGTVTISATGYSAIYNDGQFTAKVVYTYPNTLGTNSTHEVTTYGEPSTITSISCGGTVSAGSYYAVYNSGHIGSITGGATYQSNYNTIYNSGVGAYASRDYTRKYTDTTTASTEYERIDNYVHNLDKGGVIGTISGITISGTGTSHYCLLQNQGYIGTLSDCSITSTSSKGAYNYPLVFNGDSRRKTLNQTFLTNRTSETDSHLTVTAGIATRCDRDYTFDAPTIGTMRNVTVTSTSTYAFKNSGKISLMSGCTITGTQYALVNYTTGPYTERHTLQYYSGTSIFATSKNAGELAKSYKCNASEITTIDNCTITTPANTLALYNAGHIGTIQNSVITAGTDTAKNSAIYNGGDSVREYTYNVEDVLYVTANAATACTASYGQKSETKVETYAYGAPTIDLIGANNTISGASEVIKNYGVITAIDSGTDQSKATKVTASTQKGSAVYNLTGTLKSRTSTTPYTSGTAGTKTNADTYYSANIGAVKNLCITSNGYGILNGSSDANYLPTIGELGEGLEIQANCTTVDYAPVHNTTYAKIAKITGGIYTAAKAGTYAYKNANTNADHATEISGGHFKGGTAGRANAIYEPDNTTRQTYTGSEPAKFYYTLKNTTVPVTLHDGTTATGYYPVGIYQITLTLNGHGGTVGGSETSTVTIYHPVNDSTKINITNPFTRTGWNFYGWQKSENAEYLNGTNGWTGTWTELSNYLGTVLPDNTYTLDAIWATTVTYKPGDGNGSNFQQNIVEGSGTVAKAISYAEANFTAPTGGYSFTGWQDAGGKYYNPGDALGTATELTAVWSRYSVTITWDPLVYTYVRSYHWDAAKMQYVEDANWWTDDKGKTVGNTVTVSNGSADNTAVVSANLKYTKDSRYNYLLLYKTAENGTLTNIPDTGYDFGGKIRQTFSRQVWLMLSGDPGDSSFSNLAVGSVTVTVKKELPN